MGPLWTSFSCQTYGLTFRYIELRIDSVIASWPDPRAAVVVVMVISNLVHQSKGHCLVSLVVVQVLTLFREKRLSPDKPFKQVIVGSLLLSCVRRV